MANAGQFKPTHGESKPVTPEYDAWHSMKSRCLNSNDRNFQRYGGRGITVCNRWFKYENFLVDMGRRPTPKHSLDRIDNNAGYEPHNCRWATRSEQQLNRRVGILGKLNKSGVVGVSWYSQTNKWESYHWHKNRKIRLGYFTSFDEAAKARKEWEECREQTT